MTSSKVTLAFVLVSIVLFTPYVHAGGFTEIAVIDCEGNINVLPSFGGGNMRVNAPVFTAAYSALIDALYSRAQCGCPSISMDDFSKLLAPTFDYVLNYLDGPDASLTAGGCALSTFEGSSMKNFKTNSSGVFPLSNLKVTLPNTCTYLNWRTNGQCALKFPVTAFDAELGLLVKKCPNSHFPYLSLTCDGSGCDKMGRPCSSNTDCTTTNSKLSCKQIQAVVENVTRAVPDADDFFEMFQDMNCYDSGDISPGCLSGSDFITPLIRKVRDYFDGAGGNLQAATTPSFCMPTEFGTDGDAIMEAMGFNDVIIEDHQEEYSSYCDGIGACFKNRTVVDLVDMVTPGVITAWNGQRSDGSDTGSANRMNGVAFPPHNQVPVPITAGADVVAYMSCAGELWALPRSAAGMYGNMQGPLSLLNIGYAAIRTQQNCRATQRSGSISDDAFRVRFAGFPDYLVHPFTVPAASVNLGATMSDWKINVSSTPNRLSVPTTCTYAEVASTGECSATFSGLSSLLGTDLRINVYAKRCPGWQLQPEVYAECVGEGCHILNNGFKACSSNAECSGTMTCRSMQSIVEAWHIEGPNDNSYSLDILGNMIYGGSSHTCKSNSKLFEDLRYIAARAIGLNPISPSQSPSSFCFFDTNHIANTIDTWGQGQSSTSGGVITVEKLEAWANPTSTVSTTPGAVGDVTYTPPTPSTASQVVMSVFAAVAALAVVLIF